MSEYENEPAAPTPIRPARSHKRKPRESPEAELRTRIGEAVSELGAWVSERDPELGKVLREDAPKMAALLAKWATHPKAPPPLVFAIRLVASILEPLRAFGRTFRLLLGRLREARLRRASEAEVEEYFAEAPVEAPAPMTPERFSTGYEAEPAE